MSLARHWRLCSPYVLSSLPPPSLPPFLSSFPPSFHKCLFSAPCPGPVVTARLMSSVPGEKQEIHKGRGKKPGLLQRKEITEWLEGAGHGRPQGR